jgi:hypothetical protein
LLDTIKADRFPLSTRATRWRSILDKLEPPVAKAPPLRLPGAVRLLAPRGSREVL